MEVLIGGASARTYVDASKVAGVSEGTMLTHVNRVRQNHTVLYEGMGWVRESQLATRHRVAVMNARAHSRAYYRNQNRMVRRLLGYNPGSLDAN